MFGSWRLGGGARLSWRRFYPQQTSGPHSSVSAALSSLALVCTCSRRRPCHTCFTSSDYVGLLRYCNDQLPTQEDVHARIGELSAEEAAIYAQLDPERVPKHVAIIMDGNGRWAGKRALKRFLGHQQGAESCAICGGDGEPDRPAVADALCVFAWRTICAGPSRR